MRESIDLQPHIFAPWHYCQAMTDPRSGPDFQSQFVRQVLTSINPEELPDILADIELYIQHTPDQCPRLRDVLEKLRDVVKFAM